MTRVAGCVAAHKDPLTREMVFGQLAARANIGARCPENIDIPGANLMLRALAEEGRIRVEIFPRNWRVVEILTGQHKGKRTAPSPLRHAKPYKIY
jgi:hypothetical protein